jgi:hypothetical protein
MSRLMGHRLDCKLSLGGKHCTCDYYKRNPSEKPLKNKQQQIIRQIKQKQDGTTWMVSVIGPDQTYGSAWYSERAGKSALEAAKSYMKDYEDNPGARIIQDHPDEVLIVVIDQAIAPSGKQWHVHLFCVENGELRRFP